MFVLVMVQNMHGFAAFVIDGSSYGWEFVLDRQYCLFFVPCVDAFSVCSWVVMFDFVCDVRYAS